MQLMSIVMNNCKPAIAIKQVLLFLSFPPDFRLTLIVKGKGKGKEVNKKLKVCLDPNARQGQRLLNGKG